MTNKSVGIRSAVLDKTARTTGQDCREGFGDGFVGIRSAVLDRTARTTGQDCREGFGDGFYIGIRSAVPLADSLGSLDHALYPYIVI